MGIRERIQKHGGAVRRPTNRRGDSNAATSRVAFSSTLEPLDDRGSSGEIAMSAEAARHWGPSTRIDGGTIGDLERRFGRCLSDVRVHCDGRAAASAASIGAAAFTFGKDIVFGRGRYEPGAPEGQWLLFHEVAHVVQQSGAASSSRFGDSVAVNSVAEAEARDAADRGVYGAGPISIGSHTQIGVARAEEDTPSKTSRRYLDVQGTLEQIEAWQQEVAGGVSESSAVAKVLTFLGPFLGLELLRRAVQLGDFLFGITELQKAADVISNPDASSADKAKAGLWALFILVMDTMLIGGVATRIVGLLAEGAGWIARVTKLSALRAPLVELVTAAFAEAERQLPRLWTGVAEFAGKLKSWTTRLSASPFFQKAVRWAKHPIRLPVPIEALTQPVSVVMGRLFGRPVPPLSLKGGLGTRLLRDAEGAMAAKELESAHRSGALAAADNKAKGVAGETAQRLAFQLKGWTVARADLAKLNEAGHGIDLLMAKGGWNVRLAVGEAKATSTAGKVMSLLDSHTVQPGSPLANAGVRPGTRYKQASIAFNIDRLEQLAELRNPETAPVAQSFLEALSALESYATIVRVKTGVVELYELQMTPDLLRIAGRTEVVRMTFGEIKQAYQILVVGDLSPFIARGTTAAAQSSHSD